MRSRSLFFSALGLQASGRALAQVDPVPTGSPIPGDYTGEYRPQVHFSPPQGFMNDPNGMFRDADGLWHLYYQYNPTDLVAGNQHWGHATSRDLYRWENQAVALFPPDEKTFVFSGSAVIDTENTSGFFPNQTDGVVAIYTLHEEDGPETQNIAYSRDGGYTFTPYPQNPVIPSTSNQFRDPKVVRYEDHWVMTVAYPVDFAIGIFTSENLVDWTPTSNFSYHGLTGLQWECPNMIPMPYLDESGEKVDDMWLMFISINPGSPLGGSVSQYYPGHFNGTHFEAVDAAARIADFGKDNYAAQFFYGLDDSELPVSIAWASNWQYTNDVPTDGEKWRSAMSAPRENYLTKIERLGWKLASRPYGIAAVQGETLANETISANGSVTVDFSSTDSKAVYWQVDATGLTSSGEFSFNFSSPISGESLTGGYVFGSDFWINRGDAGAFDNRFFTDKFSVSYLSGETWSMSGIIDRSLLEVFVDGGVESATNTFFTKEPLTEVVFSTEGLEANVRVSITVEELTSTWH